MKITLKQLKSLIENVINEADDEFDFTAVNKPHRPKGATIDNAEKESYEDGTYDELLDWLGCYGANGDSDYKIIDGLKKQYGFEHLNDDGLGGVYHPKHWKVVGSLPPSNLARRDIIQAGAYDDILWQAISPRAKRLARAVNDPNQNSNIGKHASEGYDGKYDDIGHLSDAYMNGIGIEPFPTHVCGCDQDDQDTIAKVLGIDVDEDTW